MTKFKDVFRPGVRYAMIATLFFSLMQVFVKYIHRLPAEEIVFFRAIIALIISFVMIKQKGLKPLGNNRKLLIMRGLVGSVALLLFFYSIKNIPLATAVVLQYLSPIFTIIFAIWIMREKTSTRQWIAFGIAIIGVLLIKGFDARVSLLNMVVGISAALFSGLAYNIVRKLKDHDHPLVVVFYFPLVTVPLIFPFVLRTWIWPSWQEWLLLLGVGISVQIAQVAMTHAYQMEKASDVMIYNYLGLVYALTTGLLLFGEAIQPLALLGMGIVVLAVFFGSRGKRGQRSVAS